MKIGIESHEEESVPAAGCSVATITKTEIDSDRHRVPWRTPGRRRLLRRAGREGFKAAHIQRLRKHLAKGSRSMWRIVFLLLSATALVEGATHNACFQPPLTGPCKAGFRRYFYDPWSMDCLLFIYGGCHGNDNNFDSLEACRRACPW
ncbi:tissue factor pathway inhibitor 2-like [Penaeus japonicus]|uniref:tissue factor pathway inhibitor 2-like n=1 Tax=Penaeus japonicus TaxID=27405 RepID=UPI001C712DF2|nr:tissue factor pathway inhibitor 2-like [Penaeus japonicus]